MTVVVLASVAAGIGSLGAGVMGLVVGLFGALFAWFVWAAITWLIGTKLLPEAQTDADFGQLLRSLGFAASPGVLSVVGIIPFLGWFLNLLIGIWMLVAMVIAVRQALDYTSTGRAIGVCVIGWVVNMVIKAGIAVFLGAAGIAASALG